MHKDASLSTVWGSQVKFLEGHRSNSSGQRSAVKNAPLCNTTPIKSKITCHAQSPIK